MLVRLAVLTLAVTFCAGMASSQGYKPPRTAYGAPDLQGVWDKRSMTRLQRPKDFKALVATPEEAAAYEAKGYGRHAKVLAPVSPDAPAPDDGKVTDDDDLEHPRGLTRIRGEIRSSQIVDPADGRLPYTDAARAEAEKALKDEEIFDDPEGRPFDERCLLGGGGGVAPPIMSNDHYQIIQTRDHVVLISEMNHEARIVRLGTRQHLHPAIRPWMGDPVGWWEGDVLVVETANLSPTDAWRWNSADWIRLTTQARITERFQRISQDAILYSYTVDDPGAYTRPWRGELLFHASRARIFEFACHEGNYALTGILAGGRQKDREAAAQKGAP